MDNIDARLYHLRDAHHAMLPEDLAMMERVKARLFKPDDVPQPTATLRSEWVREAVLFVAVLLMAFVGGSAAGTLWRVGAQLQAIAVVVGVLVGASVMVGHHLRSGGR